MDREQPSAEAALQSLGSAFAVSLRRNGGWSGFARRLAMTMACGLAIFTPPVALYELSRVDEVQSWQTVEMELLGVEKRVNGTRGGGSRRGGPIWVWSFREPASGRVIEARDFEPGDLPWSGPGWSNMENKARAWQRLAGQRVAVRISPDGKSVYPSPGSKGTMTVALILCGVWWLAVGISYLRRRRQV